MDQLRAAAYLDLLNSIPAHERIAHGLLTEQTPAPRPSPSESPDETGDADRRRPRRRRPGATAPAADDCPCQECDGTLHAPDDDNPRRRTRRRRTGRRPGDDDPAATDDGAGRRRPGRRQDPGGHARARPTAGPPPRSRPEPASGPPRLHDLVFPLATLLGLADRPGEGHGLGALDPDLCRTLAATAAASPHTTLCVTITDPDGIAIGHGCAKPDAGPPPRPPAARPRPWSRSPPASTSRSPPTG